MKGVKGLWLTFRLGVRLWPMRCVALQGSLDAAGRGMPAKYALGTDSVHVILIQMEQYFMVVMLLS